MAVVVSSAVARVVEPSLKLTWAESLLTDGDAGMLTFTPNA